ncbi:MAG TPA: DUF4230 domain-containing protein [Clostridium sp.]|uniref:DUF4230 domain-containing protein n=1 Tax=Clostridium sp. TaxID=1506 RepID=UPI002F95FDEB
MYLRSVSNLAKHKIKFIFPIVFLCIMLSPVMLYLITNNINNDKVINSTVIAARLSKISELATIKYNYSNILSIKNSIKYKDYLIPFTEKSFIIKYSGYIKAGVDLKDLDVIVNNEKIIITLKKSKILDDVINSEDLFVYDEKSSMFNKLSMQDMMDELSTEKKKVEVNLLKTEFLDEANANAKLLMQGILLDMGFKNVTIIFK